MSTVLLHIDPEAMSAQIKESLAKRQFHIASSLFKALVQAEPDYEEIPLLSAGVLMSEEKFDQALEVLNEALTKKQTNNLLYKERAGLLYKFGLYALAAADAAEAVIIAPEDAEAKALLGGSLIECNQALSAVQCLEEAVRNEPASPSFRITLARAYELAGLPDKAIEVLEEGIQILPHSANLRLTLMSVYFILGKLKETVRIGEQARRDLVINVSLLTLLGRAYAFSFNHAQAALLYEEALKLAPESRALQDMLRDSLMLPDESRAPAAYVRAVYEELAPGYEADMLSRGDTAPGFIRGALEDIIRKEPSFKKADILDIGCGTGFIGLTASDVTEGRFIGVDLSGAMLAAAREKNIYQELHEKDFIDYLKEKPQKWQLCVAGDVLCYFSDLSLPLRELQRVMEQGGYFIFTLEAKPETQSGGTETLHQAGVLGPNGRYLHDEAYIRRTFARYGFVLEKLEPCRLRGGAGLVAEGFQGVARYSGQVQNDYNPR